MLIELHGCRISPTDGVCSGKATAVAGCAVVPSGSAACYSCPDAWRQPQCGQSMVRCLEKQWEIRTPRRSPHGSSSQVVRRAVVGSGSNAFARPTSAWFWDVALDVATHRQGYPQTVSGNLSSGSCLASPRRTEMELPAPGTARSRTRRERGAPLAATRLATHKKTARQRKARLIFLDESGFSESPSIRRTWAPRGKTPILVVPFNWKRLSAIASLITTPAARHVGLCLRLLPGAVNKQRVREYLRELKRHVRGRKVILLWDRLPAHRSQEVQDYIHKERRWLTVTHLPPYAPELNPVEYFWAHVSGTDLANLSATSLQEVQVGVRKVASRVRHRLDLGQGFLKHSGLF